MNESRNPTTSGILSIIAGAVGAIGGLVLFLAAGFSIEAYGLEFAYAIIGLFAIPAIMLGVVAIMGGIYALKRRGWGLALAGSICSLLLVFFLGIPAILFVAAGKDKFEVEKLWKTTTAGILSIVTGIAGTIGGLALVWLLKYLAAWYGWQPVIIGTVALIVIIVGAVAIVGGIYALKRRRWGLALAGSICSLLLVFFLGIPAILFVAAGKDEFEMKS